MTEGLTGAVGSLFTLVGTVITEITSQPLLAVMLVGGTVVPLALRTFKKMKKTSNG